jgi:hypothetical protein
LTIGAWVRQMLGDLPGAEQRLEEADRLARGAWRPVTHVWMAGLRVHQGRDADAIELLEPDTLAQAVAAQGNPALQAQPVLHTFLFSSLAFANLGRPQEALAAARAIEQEEARTGSARWAGRADNLRGWILRNLGEWGQADEANARGLELSTATHMSEPMSHAHLDLASGALLAGDLDRAGAEVAAAEALGDRHAMAWRPAMSRPPPTWPAMSTKSASASGRHATSCSAACCWRGPGWRSGSRSTLSRHKPCSTVSAKSPGWRRGA